VFKSDRFWVLSLKKLSSKSFILAYLDWIEQKANFYGDSSLKHKFRSEFLQCGPVKDEYQRYDMSDYTGRVYLTVNEYIKPVPSKERVEEIIRVIKILYFQNQEVVHDSELDFYMQSYIEQLLYLDRFNKEVGKENLGKLLSYKFPRTVNRLITHKYITVEQAAQVLYSKPDKSEFDSPTILREDVRDLFGTRKALEHGRKIE
jgi:hypothetical protein